MKVLMQLYFRYLPRSVGNRMYAPELCNQSTKTERVRDSSLQFSQQGAKRSCHRLDHSQRARRLLFFLTYMGGHLIPEGVSLRPIERVLWVGIGTKRMANHTT
jgi:hypothetical protein